MMPDSHHPPPLPDAAARQRALLDYDTTLLVEAGAGSGKTALMAGRVALMLAHGILPRDVVAITFTEAAAAELLERIVNRLRPGIQSGVVLAGFFINPFGICRQFIVETIKIDSLASLHQPLLIRTAKIEMPQQRAADDVVPIADAG